MNEAAEANECQVEVINEIINRKENSALFRYHSDELPFIMSRTLIS